MLRLCLLRHMKTAWALPGQRDIQRALNNLGKEDLAIVRGWIRERQLTPGHVFCSPATRTRQTLEGIQPAFAAPATVDFCPELYSGFTDEYLDCIMGHEKPETLLLIGHNPTCASLANILATSGDNESLNTISYKYPAGAMAIIDFDIDSWAEIKPGSGILVDFLMPKQFRQH